MSAFLAVGLGGALGAMARYGLSIALAASFGAPGWLATLGANLLGCLVMGAMASWLQGGMVSETIRLLVMVGLLGALTTFSSFTLDAYQLFARQAWAMLGFYISASLIVSLAAFAAGFVIIRQLGGGAG